MDLVIDESQPLLLIEGKTAPHQASDIYRQFALASCFVNVGFAITFLTMPITYYLVNEHDLSSSILNALRAISLIPWSFKVLFGFLSDSIPVYGHHRRPWIVFGWTIFVAANIIGTFSGSFPNPIWLCAITFIRSVGLVLADTVADGMVVEGTAFENKTKKGRMRVQCYLLRGIGMTLGAFFGGLFNNESVWGWGLNLSQCFLLQSAIPIISVLPWIPSMFEMEYRGEKLRTVKEMFDLCWDFIAVDAVWVPLFYLFFWNLCYITNPSWTNFLYTLGFSKFELGMLATTASALGVVGIATYDFFCFDHGWKNLYVWTIIGGISFAGLQILLVYGITFGLPLVVFATGGTGLQHALQYVTKCCLFKLIARY